MPGPRGPKVRLVRLGLKVPKALKVCKEFRAFLEYPGLPARKVLKEILERQAHPELLAPMEH